MEGVTRDADDGIEEFVGPRESKPGLSEPPTLGNDAEPSVLLALCACLARFRRNVNEGHENKLMR